MATVGSSIPSELDFESVISRRLESFARRRRRLLIARAILAAITVLVIAALLIAACDYLWFLTEPVRMGLSFAGYAVAAIAAWWFGLRGINESNPRVLARQMESVDTRFREDLLSAVELSDPQERNGSPIFVERLTRSVGRQIATVDPRRLLPLGLIQNWLFTVAILLVSLLALSLLPSLQFGQRMARALLPVIPIQRVSRTEIRIIEPSPASRDVAQGDAVGIVVQTSGDEVEQVRLEWVSDDGGSGETMMTRRGSEEFSANLPVGSSIIDYRIRGGDCITLWERLVPKPRPRVTQFEVTYTFPKYAGLEDQTETSEHGDLRALTGTDAKVKVSFDQPVKDALLRFDGGRYELKLDASGEEQTQYTATVPIRSPSTYSVDSVSVSSELNNPFSPRYTITPISDMPPVVRWGDEVPLSQLVSPLEVVPLSMVALDDVPFDTVTQELQINDGPWLGRKMNPETPAREITTSWSWDLAALEEEKLFVVSSSGARTSTTDPLTKLEPLQSGDIIRTRLKVRDRRGSFGESNQIEILIADDGFAKNRHDRIRAMAQEVAQLTAWLDKLKPIYELATKNDKQPPENYRTAATEAIANVRAELPELRTKFAQRVAKTLATNDATLVHWIGRSLIDIERRLDVTARMAMPPQSGEASDVEGSNTPPSDWDNFVRDARELESLVSQTRQFAQSLVGHETMVALESDSRALRASMQPLLLKDREIPEERWLRYLSIIIERVRDMERLVKDQNPALPESASQHLGRYIEWTTFWESRLKILVEDKPGQDNTRSMLADFERELRDRIGYAIFDGRISNTLRESTERFGQQMIHSQASLVDRLKRWGTEAEQLTAAAQRESDTTKVAEAMRKATERKTQFAAEAAGLVKRLSEDEPLERARVLADLRYAADLVLLRRAIENVTSDGFQPYKDETAETVHREIWQAAGRLEAVHVLTQTQREMLTLLEDQQRLRDDGVSRFTHPMWYEQIQNSILTAEKMMQTAAVSWEQYEGFAKLRYNPTSERISNQLGKRRYSNDPVVPVILPLQENLTALSASLDALQPVAEEARQTLMKYILSLPEQAREAAKKAEEAKEKIESRPDSKPETATEAAEKVDDAKQETAETVRSLVDLANNSDMRDAEARELARDADSAALQLQEAVKQVDEAVQQAETAANDEDRSKALEQAEQSLESLEQKLEQTAEHFEKAQAGEDVAESRETLRQAEADLGIQEMLDQRYKEAEFMAEKANSDPREMLAQLERELTKNEPMQEELSEIADQAADAAERILNQAAKDEANLRSELEKADQSFEEQKQRLRGELRGLGRQAKDLERSLLGAAEKAANWNKPSEMAGELREAKQQLSEAADKVEQLNSNAPLADLKQTTSQLNEAVQRASQLAQKIAESSQAQKNDAVHENDNERVNDARRLRQLDQETRDQRLRDARTQENYWKETEREAGRRVQDAERQQREAENAANSAQQRLDREPNNSEWLSKEVANSKARAESAQKAAEQARQSRELAKEQEKQVQQQMQEIRDTPLAELDNAKNPAAEVAEKLNRAAADELGDIAGELKELAEKSNIDDSLRARPDAATRLAQQQSNLNEEVELAAELLARAARHQERLGKDSRAAELDKAAAAVGVMAKDALQQAAEKLSDAAQDASKSAEASQAMAKANESLAEQASRIADMLEAQRAESEASSSSPPANTASENGASDNQNAAQKMAQTLDELDQAVNQSSPMSQGQPSPSQQAQSQQSQSAEGQSSEGQPSEQASSESSSQPGQSSPTAAEASQTLASAAEAQAQRAARQRASQTGQPQPGQDSSEPSSEPGQSTTPSDRSTNASLFMPQGGDLSTIGIERVGEDWGQLREQRTDDAVEERAAAVPSAYRREIEAYFRAIAERAAKK